MTHQRAVAALVLAAGQASRLGRPKQLLSVDKQPLLQRTLDVVRTSTLDPKLLVLGAYREQIEEQVDLDGFTIVGNPDYASGQASSLRAGLDALPEQVQGVVVVLGDQPILPPGLLDTLAEAFDPQTDLAVQPQYADRPGNPILLARGLFDELGDVTGDTGAREVLKRHRDQIRRLDFSRFPTPRDVDTEDDYQLLLRDWFSLGAPDLPRYCQRCGAEMGFTMRHDRLRPVCPACDFTSFADPKIAVATIIDSGDGVVMQRRAINPGLGKWTFPSGFVDRGEDVVTAARREVLEEVGIEVSDLDLFDVYSDPWETVTLIVYVADCPGIQPTVGDESDKVGVIDPNDLPELAFPRDQRIINDWLKRR